MGLTNMTCYLMTFDIIFNIKKALSPFYVFLCFYNILLK